MRGDSQKGILGENPLVLCARTLSAHSVLLSCFHRRMHLKFGYFTAAHVPVSAAIHNTMCLPVFVDPVWSVVFCHPPVPVRRPLFLPPPPSVFVWVFGCPFPLPCCWLVLSTKKSSQASSPLSSTGNRCLEMAAMKRSRSGSSLETKSTSSTYTAAHSNEETVPYRKRQVSIVP